MARPDERAHGDGTAAQVWQDGRYPELGLSSGSPQSPVAPALILTLKFNSNPWHRPLSRHHQPGNLSAGGGGGGRCRCISRASSGGTLSDTEAMVVLGGFTGAGGKAIAEANGETPDANPNPNP